MQLKMILRLATAIIPLTGGAHAANLLVNGSFETGDFTGWNLSGNATIVNGAIQASDGDYALAFNFGNLTTNAVLSQIFVTIPQVHYTLGFDIGVNGDNNGTQGLRIVLQGAGLLYQGDILNSTSSTTTGGGVDYDSYSFSFIADSTLTTLSFQDISDASYRMDSHLDNVQIQPASNPVPEPGTFFPAALLVVGALLWRRRPRSHRSVRAKA
jgi:MYXO-CTERM domain-containing protein